MKTKFSDTLPGHLPLGFVALDLAHALNLPLIDPDDGYKTIADGQHTKFGNGIIGGDHGKPKVVVAANGGSDLVYIPDGDKAMAKRIIDALLAQDYASGLFVDSKLGKFPGTLSLDDIALEGTAITPHPAIAVNFRSFDTVCGEPVRCTAEVADTILQQGQGMHGSFSRADTWNFIAMQGPDFKSQFVDPAPTSNADLGRTIARLMQLNVADKGSLVGRVLSETLPGGSLPEVTTRVVTSEPAPNGLVTVLDMQMVGTTRYFDAQGSPAARSACRRPRCRTRRSERAVQNLDGCYIRVKVRAAHRASAAIQTKIAASISSYPSGRRPDPRRPADAVIGERAIAAAKDVTSQRCWLIAIVITPPSRNGVPATAWHPSTRVYPVSRGHEPMVQGPTPGWPAKGRTAAKSRHCTLFF